MRSTAAVDEPRAIRAPAVAGQQESSRDQRRQTRFIQLPENAGGAGASGRAASSLASRDGPPGSQRSDDAVARIGGQGRSGGDDVAGRETEAEGAGGGRIKRQTVLLPAGEAPMIPGSAATEFGQMFSARGLLGGRAGGRGRKRKRTARPLPAKEWRRKKGGLTEEDFDSDEEWRVGSQEQGEDGSECERSSQSARGDGEGDTGRTREQRGRERKASRGVKEEPGGESEAFHGESEEGKDVAEGEEDGEENGECEDVELDGGLRVPARLYRRLFVWQQVGLKWLWELHCQQVGCGEGWGENPCTVHQMVMRGVSG